MNDMSEQAQLQQQPPSQGELLSRAVESQIGMLTCQVLEMNVRIQAAQQEMGRMAQALAEKDAELADLRAAKAAKVPKTE